MSAITEGVPATASSVRFKLNGVVKTISPPITGLALHTIAGNPSELVTNGKAVPKNHDKFAVSQDQEFHSRHHLAQPQHIPQDTLLPGGQPGVSQKPLDPDTDKDKDKPGVTHLKSAVEAESDKGAKTVKHGEDPNDIAF